MLNLVDNAIHVTSEGDRIEITAVTLGDELALGVRDTGPGIAADDIPTLFARTGRTLRSRPGGTGLGLPIVAAIAEAHGGTVTASSELGVGTCIEIVLPGVER
jgi:signal transduction histidine kinase